MNDFTKQPFTVILNRQSFSSFENKSTGFMQGLGFKSNIRLHKFLQSLGPQVTIHETTDLKHATKLAKETSGSTRLVVAAGGDGTVSAVASGLVGSDCILGILPAGSGNDIARGLGLPNNLPDAARVLQTGRIRKMDIGQFGTNQKFINTFGVGFDGKAAYNASKTFLFRGKWKYLYGVIKSLFTYRATPMRVELNDNSITETFLMVSVANGPFEGGGIAIAPSADLFDGVFNVVMIRDVGLFARIPLLLRVLINGATEGSCITIKKSRLIRIRPVRACHAHADGEIVGDNLSDVSIILLPEALNVITGL